MAQSKIRTNFHSSSEALINKQINMELHASYVYMSMVSRMSISHSALWREMHKIKFELQSTFVE